MPGSASFSRGRPRRLNDENSRGKVQNVRADSSAENQLRVVAVGRRNWLFAGSFEGARRAALLYSLVQSCKLVDVAPFTYLKDVLLRIAVLHESETVGKWSARIESRFDDDIAGKVDESPLVITLNSCQAFGESHRRLIPWSDCNRPVTADIAVPIVLNYWIEQHIEA